MSPLVKLSLLACLAACGHSAGGGGGGAADGTAATSRCTASGAMISCVSQSATVGGRTVTFAQPLGDAPAAGWPAVVFYQGSFVPGSHAFAATMGAQFGQYELTSTIQALLDKGYVVIAPNAQNDGSLYWQTNIPPYATSWAGCDDDVFVHALLAAMGDGTFGSLDASRRYAMGISSGGFMTSRMAVSYDGQFRALAIASGSYATCGPTCTVPALPADHPPTLFLHGGADQIVPESAMTPYKDKLVMDGREAMAIVDANAGHEWLHAAVAAVPMWFDSH